MQPALFCEPGLFPGLPGPAVGPKGPEIGRKPGAIFIILSSLRSAQVPLGFCRGRAEERCQAILVRGCLELSRLAGPPRRGVWGAARRDNTATGRTEADAPNGSIDCALYVTQ